MKACSQIICRLLKKQEDCSRENNVANRLSLTNKREDCSRKSGLVRTVYKGYQKSTLLYTTRYKTFNKKYIHSLVFPNIDD